MSDLAATPTDRRRPRRRLAVLIGLLGTFLLLCCGGGTLVVLSGFAGDGDDPAVDRLAADACGQGGVVDANGKLPSVDSYGPDKIRNAAIIINVGKQMSVPPRGWIIAVATAMQESNLTNLGNLGSRNDHDSIGLFQQRPSMGWGKPEQLRDPAYTARKFYEKLLKVTGWQTRPLTDAAQRVQISAFPDAYAKHEPIATRIVNLLTNGAARAVNVGNQLRCAAAGDITASGYTRPVRANIVSGFRTSERPGHNGVDLAAARGTDIHAAANGRVLVARCDPAGDGSYSCDVDGYPGKGGCGWFVDILHAGNIITRYCHMVRRPVVKVGDLVQAGQVIGQVGTSGDSSGPHLHFEVHVNGNRGSAGAINPAPFMSERGIPLGGKA
ncbi:M23 family metallopeptidase [Micromonospora zhanjiangensis]|uniref:M23 family metallopeptidase n=1 Tax=Micromonospora zhanjiangensis TaxID=1522057 RepID=A0ABV8KE88_9ACTN